jgi:hypothetical protein
MRNWQYDRFYSKSVPTNEDVLDVNFRAIVSDLRGLISGTLSPRCWSDISSTWLTDDEQPRNTGYYRLDAPDKIQASQTRCGRRAYERKRALKPNHHVRKLANIMMLTGMTEELALEAATAILIDPTEVKNGN